MEMHDTRAIVQTAGQTASKTSSVVSGVDHQQSKRAKALADKLVTLQKDRKFRLGKTSIIRQSLQGFKNDKSRLQIALKELIETCNDAKRIQESLLSFLPVDEKEKHETWFKAKMLSNNDFICETKGLFETELWRRDTAKQQPPSELSCGTFKPFDYWQQLTTSQQHGQQRPLTEHPADGTQPPDLQMLRVENGCFIYAIRDPRSA